MSGERAGAADFDDVLALMRLLAGLEHELARTSRAMQASLGVTAEQRMLVRTVGRFPGITVGRLAELLCVEPATVSTALSRLEQRGIVARESDPRDRRRTAISLTARGRALDAPAARTVESAVAAALAETTPTEIAEATRLLSRIEAQLRRQRSSDAPVDDAR